MIVDDLANVFRIMIGEKTSFVDSRLYLRICAFRVTLKKKKFTSYQVTLKIFGMATYLSFTKRVIIFEYFITYLLHTHATKL